MLASDWAVRIAHGQRQIASSPALPAYLAIRTPSRARRGGAFVSEREARRLNCTLQAESTDSMEAERAQHSSDSAEYAVPRAKQRFAQAARLASHAGDAGLHQPCRLQPRGKGMEGGCSFLEHNTTVSRRARA
jgi:hypothetical protein